MPSVKVSDLNTATTPYDGTEYSLGIQDGRSVKIPVPNLAGSAGASLIGVTPNGAISSTTVAGALNELDAEKATVESVAVKADTTTVNAALALKTNITDLAASTGASLVGFIGPGTGAVARTVESQLRESISVWNYIPLGTVTSTTDCSPYIQAAIDANGGKVIHFPIGNYRINSTITVSVAGTVLSGDATGGGSAGYTTGATLINYGIDDGVFFYNASGLIQGCGINNISIIRKSNISTGSGIHIKHCATFDLYNCFVAEHYNGYFLEGVTSSFFAKIAAYTGNFFTSTANSSHLKIFPLPTYVSPNFADAGWINTFSELRLTSSFITDYGIYVGAGDSNLFTTGYIGGSDKANIYVKIQLLAPNNSAHFNNLYLDGVSFDPLIQTTTGAFIETDSQASSKDFDIQFNNCIIGQPGTGILITENLPNLVISGCSILNTSGSGISIMNDDVSGAITGNTFLNCGRLVDSSSAIYVGYAKSLSITGNNFETCNGALNIYGIRFAATANINTVAITGNSFDLVDIDYLNLATITNCVVTGNSSSNIASTILTYIENDFNASISLKFGGAAVGMTYTTKVGNYIKNQNVVNYTIYIQLSSKGSSTGVATISGLPYSSKIGTPVCGPVRLTAMATTVGDTALGSVIAGGTTEVLLHKQVTGSSQQLTDVDFTNTSIIQVSGFYFT